MDEFVLKRSKKVFKLLLHEGLDTGITIKEEYNSMNPEEKTSGKFYCNFNVHKAHAYEEASHVRPIGSGLGSITEGIATLWKTI